jgi:hypothetical protein
MHSGAYGSKEDMPWNDVVEMMTPAMDGEVLCYHAFSVLICVGCFYLH